MLPFRKTANIIGHTYLLRLRTLFFGSDTGRTSHRMRMVGEVAPMLALVAASAKIPETVQITTEERSQFDVAHAADRVLQVWVNLDLSAELGCANLHCSSTNCFHVALKVVESDAT